MPPKVVTVQQFQPPKIPNGWKPDEKRYAQQIEDLFRRIFTRFGRIRFEDLGDGLKITITDLEGDYSSLQLQLQGFQAAVNGNRLDFSVAGLQVINSDGYPVFAQELDTGNLTITGTVYAVAGNVGGFEIEEGHLRAEGIELNAEDGRITVRDVTITEPDASADAPNMRILTDGTVAKTTWTPEKVPKTKRGTVSVSADTPVTLDYTALALDKTPVIVCGYSGDGDGGVLVVKDKTTTGATITGTNTTAQDVDYIVMEAE